MSGGWPCKGLGMGLLVVLLMGVLLLLLLKLDDFLKGTAGGAGEGGLLLDGEIELVSASIRVLWHGRAGLGGGKLASIVGENTSYTSSSSSLAGSFGRDVRGLAWKSST